jgi:hypothetical protein
MGSTWEEVDYCNVELYEPVDLEGNAMTEYDCPHCTQKGVRNPGAEKRRVIDEVRAYSCSNDHTWYFVAGGTYDGISAVPSRFERDLGI